MLSFIMLVSALSISGVSSAHAAEPDPKITTVSVTGASAKELYRHLTEVLGATPQRGIQNNSIWITKLFLYLQFQRSLFPQAEGVEQTSDVTFRDQNSLPQAIQRKTESSVVIPGVELSAEVAPNTTESSPAALFMILRSAGLSPSYSVTYDGGLRFSRGFILRDIRCEIPEPKCEITGYGIISGT
jgi:hypothetical protein